MEQLTACFEELKKLVSDNASRITVQNTSSRSWRHAEPGKPPPLGLLVSASPSRARKDAFNANALGTLGKLLNHIVAMIVLAP